MGFFDFLRGGSNEQQIHRNGKKLKNKDTPIEDRQEAARWLARQKTPAATRALLGRFEMDYEHGMKDAAEKNEVAELVLALGDQAIEPLRDFLLHTQKFARGLALYEQLTSTEKAQALALEMLASEGARSELKPERKRNLLVKLADFRGPEVAAAVTPFLTDYDEGCRFGAAEALFVQAETPEIREALLKVLTNPKEESNRLRVRVAEVAAKGRWSLGPFAEAIASNPPGGFTVKDGVLVAA